MGARRRQAGRRPSLLGWSEGGEEEVRIEGRISSTNLFLVLLTFLETARSEAL